ncbi:MAG: DUF3553 domain-containing protein [Planctomycetes bacterium]|nr:DUF3553 domain-containing protein [Planctomycetota bacterium]
MDEIRISPGLVGSKVRNAARPEWGSGTILRIEQIRGGAQLTHRISIQFATGHRTLLVPPARLTAAGPEPERAAGWLDGIGKTTLDDRLRKLPDQVTQVLGSPRERLTAVVPLYAVTTDPPSLLRWAISQSGVRDPLTHWTRDELLAALRDFCNERDAHLRNVAALLKQQEGPKALGDTLGTIPAALRQPILAALQRPI